jgi:glycerol-3-phosphate dehydrogenase (NAD(P)+)
MRRVTVLGDGGWGTCLAILLGACGNRVTLWGAFEDYIEELRSKRENVKFLPGIRLPDDLELTADLSQALEEADVVLVAIPSLYLREVLNRCRSAEWKKSLVVSVVKGIEPDSLMRMSEVIQTLVEPKQMAVLSGPSIAYEVARGIPTAVVVASFQPQVAEEVQRLLTTERFRVYTSCDVVGVELGGALKNVIAIACGVADGLGFGANTKAALVARGLVEMARLGVAMGADLKTFYGLSGLGDLVTTCFSPHSRNRSVGEKLGRGMTLHQIQCGMEQVAEGVTTTRSAVALARRYGVEMPIAEAVHRVLYVGWSAEKVVADLMLRTPKSEWV